MGIVLASSIGLLMLLFFAQQPLRQQLWLYLLNPDLLIGQWFGAGQMTLGFFDRLPILLVALATAALMLLAGNSARRLLGIDGTLAPLERLVFGALLGYGMLATVVLVVGLFTTKGIYFGVGLALLGLIAGVDLAAHQRGWLALVSSSASLRNPREAWTGTERALAIFISLLIGVTLWGSILPPHDFDVREYHLQVPKEWYQAGQISFLTHNVYGNMPLLAEVPAIVAMNLFRGDLDWWHGALTGKLLMAVASMLAAGSIYSIARRLSLGRLSSLLAVAIYVSHPWVLHVSMGGLNDGVLASFALLTLHALLLDVSLTQRAILGGLAAGMACCCKYPALVLVLFPALVWIVRDALLVLKTTEHSPQSQKNDSQAAWRSAAIATAAFLAASLVTIGPWYGKNLYFTGNPVYPLAGSVFGAPPLDDEAISRWERAHQVPRDEKGNRYTPAQLASSLWRALVTGEYASAALPLFVIGILFAFRAAGPSRAIALWLLWGLAIWWLVSHRLDRFLLPILPLAALLAAIACDNLLKLCAIDPALPILQKRSWGFLALLLILLMDGALILASPLAADNRWFVSLAALRVDATQGGDPTFPRRVRESHAILNQVLPRDELGVLLVGDAAPFDIERPCSYNVCFNPCLLCDWTIGPTDDEIRLAFSSRSVGYLLVDWAEIARYQSAGNYGYDPRFHPQLVEQLVQRKIIEPIALEPLAEGRQRSFSLYRLTPATPPPKP